MVNKIVVNLSTEKLNSLDFLHDSELAGFKIQKLNDEVIVIDFITSDKKSVNISFKKVMQFYASSIMSQNVLLEVQILSGADAISSIHEHKKSMLTIEPEINDIIDKINMRKALAVRLVPSVGFEALIICEELEINF